MSNDNIDFRHTAIRDPLYGFVGLSEQEINLVDTEMFRRLHGIKQLSHAYLVYPSAVHTRFEHSLGATHIAGKMCDELQLDNEQKQLVRLTVLLHDIGHGPFSHLFENILQKTNKNEPEIHELISRLIIENDNEIGKILGNSRDQVISLLSGSNVKSNIENFSLLHQIVSSGLDADKLDYLRRDSYHVGVAYGTFDLDRILHTLTRTPDSDSIAVTMKGKDALESYRIARYLMHIQVYEHHTRLVADRMFLQALNMAIHDEKVIEQDSLNIDDPLRFFSFYKSLDDNSIYDLVIKQDTISSNILKQVRQRRLLKRAIQFGERRIPDPRRRLKMVDMAQDEFDLQAKDIAQDLGLQPHDVIYYKSDVKIKLYGPTDLLVLDGDTIYDLMDVSPISAKGNVVAFYVFGPDDDSTRDKIKNKIVTDLRMPLDKIDK